MTRDDIIRMAQEAGLVKPSHPFNPWDASQEALERFADLVVAAEREKVAEWMMARGYSTGHGDSIEELLEELDWQITEKIAMEREACAKVLDEMAAKDKLSNYYQVAALAIRARGQA